MKFGKETLLALAATCCLLTSQADAFVPASIRSTKFALVNSRMVTSTTSPNKLSRTTVVRRLADDDDDLDAEDDEEGPLGKGIDSVSWLPSVVGKKGESVPSAKVGTEILPLFPLGGFVYTPNSEHILNIFEPRYRQMYNDILMNGAKRFVVATSHPTEEGRFAQTGVLFELEDLKEVSEQTQDKVKYVCNHKVTGRVTLHKVLNPEAWASRETYLKVEGTTHDDSGKNDAKAVVSAEKEEEELRVSFETLVEIQHNLEEDVRFTRGSIAKLAVKDGPGEDGLWQTIRLWQSFADQRLVVRQNELQHDFQEKLQEFLKKEKGMKDEELPSAIGFMDLSPALQQELQEVQRRMAIELQPLVLESTLTMQKMLEAEDHIARCNLLKYFFDAEKKRLSTKSVLQGVFSNVADSVSEASMPREELITDDDKLSESEKKPDSKFFDDEDAFQ